jgi:hypothetical protein
MEIIITPMNESREKPYCYGKLDCVFPLTDDGLRQSPESCMPCHCKTECLRDAVKGEDGVKVKEEVVDRAYASGTMGFLERWSRRKLLHQRKRKHGNKPSHRRGGHHENHS